MRKILLVSGDSNSDPDYICKVYKKDRSEVVTWADVTAKELNLELVELSKYGRGNDYIFYSLMEAIATHRENIEAVIVAWSDIADHDFFYIKALLPIVELRETGNPKARVWLQKANMENITRDFWKSEVFDKSVYSGMISNLFTKMFALINVCKMHSIKLIMFQTNEIIDLDLFIKFQENNNLPEKSLISKEIFEDMYFNNPMFKVLEENKNILLGWPFLENHNGDYLTKKRADPEYRISDEDWHPSEKCHREYAEKIIKRYKELYG